MMGKMWGLMGFGRGRKSETSIALVIVIVRHSQKKGEILKTPIWGCLFFTDLVPPARIRGLRKTSSSGGLAFFLLYPLFATAPAAAGDPFGQTNFCFVIKVK